MTPTLMDPAGRAAVLSRLRRLEPTSRRAWGRMTPHQAICHLSDSFLGMMGARPVASVGTVFGRTVVKWVALYAPMPWPRGVRTMPEVDQEIGGTRPIDFDRDRQSLEAAIEAFAGRRAEDLHPHPLFGGLTTSEWQRWAYLHLDHHLRQFGV